VHTQAVALFTQLGNQDNLNFELRHKAIIDRFGRYPHRNAILGRSPAQRSWRFWPSRGLRSRSYLAVATVLVAAYARSMVARSRFCIQPLQPYALPPASTARLRPAALAA